MKKDYKYRILARCPVAWFCTQVFREENWRVQKWSRNCFLVLVTSTITIPVGFDFYEPDEGISAWKKADQKLKKRRYS